MKWKSKGALSHGFRFVYGLVTSAQRDVSYVYNVAVSLFLPLFYQC